MQAVHLNALRALEAALRLGSFRAAAEALNVTPAAVGQQIRTLEIYLDRRLFDRTATGARPTPEAEAVARQLTQAFVVLGQVLGELQKPDASKRVALTMTQAMAEGWLPRVLPDFFAREPELDLRLETSRALVDLADGAFDFAIRHMGDPAEDLASVPLFPSLIAPVCTAGFAARYGLSSDVRSLAGVPLAHTPLQTSDPDWVDWPEWCARFGVAMPVPAFGQSVSGGASGVRLAGAGLGLILSGLVDCQHLLRAGDLVMPFGPEKVATSAYWYRLVWLKARRLSPLQRRFRDWIAAMAAEQRADLEALLVHEGGRSGVTEPSSVPREPPQSGV